MSKTAAKPIAEAEIATEVLAASIVALSDGMKQLRAGRLNDEAIVLLLQHSTKINQRDIKMVLWGLDTLASKYLRKPAK